MQFSDPANSLNSITDKKLVFYLSLPMTRSKRRRIAEMDAVQLKQDTTPASSHPTRRPISLPGFNRSGSKDGIEYHKNKHLTVLTIKN